MCNKVEGSQTLVNTSKLVGESRYHSLDPSVLLLGHANEGLYTEMGLKILALKKLIGGMCCLLRGWGCFDSVQRMHVQIVTVNYKATVKKTQRA